MRLVDVSNAILGSSTVLQRLHWPTHVTSGRSQGAANSGLLAAGERSREDGVAEDGDEGEDDNEGEDAQCDENEGEAEDEHEEAEAREDAVQLVEEDGGDVNEEEEGSRSWPWMGEV